jgi:hypothetical protein
MEVIGEFIYFFVVYILSELAIEVITFIAGI